MQYTPAMNAVKGLIVATFCCLALKAQEIPRFEVSVDGSYFRVHSSGAEDAQLLGVPDFVLGQQNLNFNLYGWHSSLTENVNRWFAGDLDVAGDYGSPAPHFLCSAATVPIAVDCVSGTPHPAPILTKLHTFMYGPRVSKRGGRFVPFAHVLLGVGHISGTLNHTALFVPNPLIVIPQNTSASNTAFAMAPGVGVDLNTSHRFAIHVFELDYVMTRFYNERQDNGRVSAGVTFQFGTK